jgi:aspartyl-tRNA(Asn)/glutamyl-tRNA(Gln) amidotransferase subunit B
VSAPTAAPPRTDWEPVIGLEIHVQLKTLTKMFCRCRVEYGSEPNSNTCPVCLAFPGALPVPNRRAIEWTVKLGVALGCDIAERALFHRKNYFYQDLPKGYQISQYDRPLCTDGAFTLPRADGDLTVGIVRAHLEEDAAKSVHVGGHGGRIGGADYSLVDFNRGGTPLVEIVTRPDLHSAEDAKRFLQLLRQTIVELGISDAEMEKGTLRADANVSVRPAGVDELRTRTELKNMNSFTFIARGIEREIERQIEVWESGGEVVQQTFDFHPDTDRLTPRRQKEEADDYRYFPEPDLVPVEPATELVEQLRAEVPELPGTRIGRLSGVVGLETATGLVTGARDRLFEAVVEAGAEPRAAANVLMNQFAGTGVEPSAVDPRELAALIEGRDRVPRATLLEALAASGDSGFRAELYLAEESVTDTGELEPLVERVLAANPGQVEQYRAGKRGLLGYFVGQVMKETGGKADARVVNTLLRSRLDS